MRIQKNLLVALSFLISFCANLESADLVDSGSGVVVEEDIMHANGNVYNHVLLTGQSVTLRTDGSKITRVSFLDENEAIVQVEFSGKAVVTEHVHRRGPTDQI